MFTKFDVSHFQCVLASLFSYYLDKWLKLVVKNNLVDQFKQTWTSKIEHSSKGDNYKLYKHDLKFEDYLDVLDDKDKFLLVKFKTSNYRSWALA